MEAAMMLSVSDLSVIFSDLTPIEQDDGPEPVCVISYSSSFNLAYGYMRSVWKCDEVSDRALRLTALCLKLNPANFTVWHFRRHCLRELKYTEDFSKITSDLALAATLGGSNPKNYQIWYHRRALLELGDAPMLKNFILSELEYTSGVLGIDSKNYHAWSHRQWIVRSANAVEIWENEVLYADRLIKEDPRNNSSWNQRWFACHRAEKSPLDPNLAKREIDFVVCNAEEFDPYNESPWRYLIAIVKEQQQAGLLSVESIREIETKVENVKNTLTNANRNPDACTNWVSARIDLLSMSGDESSLNMAKGLAESLASTYDTIRKKYWEIRIRDMQRLLEVAGTTK